MAMFEVGQKEYELKLGFKSVKHLEGLYEGGSLGFVGVAMSGSLEVFADVIHAGLFHTGESLSKETVEQAIEKAFNDGKIDLEYIHKTINEVVLESFFFAKVVKNMKAKNPEVFEQLNEILTTTE
ncbi:tail assembly chaperone [Cytobacillus purgationiresistens]|uniref:DNA-binding protein YbaB n=1 Tax=Cytobacillus purgationiresistens TaxID=863449 RepID=A0ABU0AHI5_9BACI|nr:tail assembly chaperone [Cytobacillus purgationiresistens]MDQ0270721.1 DNA-binding protein YbaB [Cytobacillus purgationiresistens]